MNVAGCRDLRVTPDMVEDLEAAREQRSPLWRRFSLIVRGLGLWLYEPADRLRCARQYVEAYDALFLEGPGFGLELCEAREILTDTRFRRLVSSASPKMGRFLGRLAEAAYQTNGEERWTENTKRGWW